MDSKRYCWKKRFGSAGHGEFILSLPFNRLRMNKNGIFPEFPMMSEFSLYDTCIIRNTVHCQ
jgi:hypothetical protein